MAVALDAARPDVRGGASTSRLRCPQVRADPALLERVIANLIANALRYSPPGEPPLADRQRTRRPGRAAGGRPGARHPGRRPRPVFAPFQRLGDTDNTTGVGLGLALSRGLTEAMGGTL